MQLGMIGLGRMGANMVQRLLRAGHECVVYDRNPASVSELEAQGASGATDLDAFLARLTAPARGAWDIPGAGREAREDRLEVLHRGGLAANHQAVATLQPPHATAGADIEIVDAAPPKGAGAGDVILII